MSELLTVKWFENPKSLNEIYQQTGMVFSFVTSSKQGSQMCHEWVRCRDFLHDAVRSQITNTRCSIYNFTFDPGKNPNLDMKKMRMLVSKLGLVDKDVESFKNKMKAALVLVNHYEKHANITLTKMEEVNTSGSDKKAVYLFTGSGIWMTSPFLVSMYTFLIRLGDKEIKFKNKNDLISSLKDLGEKYALGKICDNDAGYIRSSGNKMHIFLKNRSSLFPKKDGVHDIFLAKHDINSFHNNCGINSLSNFYSPDKELNARAKTLVEKELGKDATSK